MAFRSLIRTSELCSKVLPFGKAQINLAFRSLIRTFAPKMKWNMGWMMAVVAVLLMAAGCADYGSRGSRNDYELREGNAVYYWRTDLRLDSTERAFLGQYHINKVYCRYFDVVMLAAGDGDSLVPMPNATITFADTLPDSIELVPTIYITEDCMHEWHEGLAEKIVKRILQMNETNDITGVREIQMDCDYTARSRQTYYRFLEEIGREWIKNNQSSSLSTLTFPLSTTIRLHQLQMAVPPVDYGVLMLYNTGDPRKFAERNPVLDIRDVQPYVKYLSGYGLPLAVAYPVYRWQRNIHNVRVEHTVEASEILNVKQMVEHQCQDLRRAIITYHLDEENIHRYPPDVYEKIYKH